MILHLPPGSSPLAQAAADAVLALHIGGGLIGIGAGTAALVLRKGGLWHRRAGNLFFVGMLAMAAVGIVVSPMIGQPGNSSGGLLACYLVTTGWVTVRRAPGASGVFEVGAFLVGLITAGGAGFLGFKALSSPTGLVDGVPAGPPFIMAGLTLFAVALDLRVILQGGVSGGARIARHLWRLCAALLVADFSLFIGQPKVFPAGLRGTPIMFLPELFVFAFLIYWMTKVRLKRRPRQTMIAAGA